MEETKKTGPKDVFLHLLLIVALYLSAIQLGNLLFQYINIYIPDNVEETFRFVPELSKARWAIATLIIVFPVYIWVSWFLEKYFKKNPEKRAAPVRRWLLNLTLFIAGVIIIGDIVLLVYNFLEGELTLRFGLKIFAVLLISTAIFWYYIWNLRRGAEVFRGVHGKVLVYAVIVVIAVVTVLGFFVVGAPKSQRAFRFDERRISDLQNIQWELINFWQKKDRLPQALDELKDSISGYIPPEDPETKAAYGYKVLGDLKFELCADFKTTSEDKKYRGTRGAFYGPYAEGESFWDHGIGRVCFEKIIDTEKYSIKDELGPSRIPPPIYD